MTISKLNKITSGAAAAALLAGAALTAGASSAQAQSLIPGVTGCGAAGVKQERGALLGALAGGLLGNSVSGHNRTTGTVVGAAVGAAAGSAVGCQMQHNEQRGGYASTYTRNGYRLSSVIQPASFRRVDDTLVATSSVNLRSAPSVRAARVGQLRAGERFQALAEVRGTNWILVGQNGVGVGYVSGDYVGSPGARYAYGY